jgi:hypothetical protein
VFNGDSVQLRNWRHLIGSHALGRPLVGTVTRCGIAHRITVSGRWETKSVAMTLGTT